MTTVSAAVVPASADGRPPEPAWDIARLFPPQGHWTPDDYLALETNHLVEFVDGAVDVLEMPTPLHQTVSLMLLRLLDGFVRQHGLGRVFYAPVPLLLWPGRIREPDLLFISQEHRSWIQATHCAGADLVMEILSTDRQHDLVTKRTEYARAGIPEYWIVDPQERRITVLRLQGDVYLEHGSWGVGEHASSASMVGFGVEVDEVFAD